MKKAKLLIVVLTTMLLASCTHQMMNFSIIAGQDVNIKIPESAKSTIKVKGTGGKVEVAYNKALSKAGNPYDALINGKIKLIDYVFWIGFSVEGTPIQSNQINKIK